MSQASWRHAADQLKRLKELEREYKRLRRDVSDLTLDRLILTEAARVNFQALHVVEHPSTMCRRHMAHPEDDWPAKQRGLVFEPQRHAAHLAMRRHEDPSKKQKGRLGLNNGS